MQKIAEYNSKDNSNFDFELFIRDKEQLNILLNSHSNLSDWYIDSEAFRYIMNN